MARKPGSRSKSEASSRGRGERFRSELTRTGLRRVDPDPAPAGKPGRGSTFRNLLDALPDRSAAIAAAPAPAPPPKAVYAPAPAPAARPLAAKPSPAPPAKPARPPKAPKAAPPVAKSVPRPVSREAMEKRAAAAGRLEATAKTRKTPPPKADLPETADELPPLLAGGRAQAAEIDTRLQDIFSSGEPEAAPAPAAPAPASPAPPAEPGNVDYAQVDSALADIFGSGAEEAVLEAAPAPPPAVESDAPAAKPGGPKRPPDAETGPPGGPPQKLPDFISRVMDEFTSRIEREAELAETAELEPDKADEPVPTGSSEILKPAQKTSEDLPKKDLEALKDLFTDSD